MIKGEEVGANQNEEEGATRSRKKEDVPIDVESEVYLLHSNGSMLCNRHNSRAGRMRHPVLRSRLLDPNPSQTQTAAISTIGTDEIIFYDALGLI